MGLATSAWRACSAIFPRSQEGQVGSMFERIVNRMVDRAMPPYFEDFDQERIAVEAAENGIRQTARVAGIIGGILVVGIAALLYLYFPHPQISQGPAEATRAAPPARAEENAKLRQAIENLQRKLDSIEDLQTKLEEETQERNTLQGKVAELEGQAAEVSRQRQAAKVLAAPKVTPPPTRQATRPAGTPVRASRPSTYPCGDGRTVRDPTECEPAAPGR